MERTCTYDSEPACAATEAAWVVPERAEDVSFVRGVFFAVLLASPVWMVIGAWLL